MIFILYLLCLFLQFMGVVHLKDLICLPLSCYYANSRKGIILISSSLAFRSGIAPRLLLAPSLTHLTYEFDFCTFLKFLPPFLTNLTLAGQYEFPLPPLPPTLNSSFNYPITSIPPFLTYLTLDSFNHPLTLPPSLTHLTLGGFNLPLTLPSAHPSRSRPYLQPPAHTPTQSHPPHPCALYTPHNLSSHPPLILSIFFSMLPKRNWAWSPLHCPPTLCHPSHPAPTLPPPYYLSFSCPSPLF
eukprot:Phypoly_transcript_14867.p1 GENE.Phypoly_transcript_14867~~Phypoly_transcript_14867.p1  ORF type:complete len:242 (+),score=27.58 Phypoly_transcript_14867:74-799(+)